MKEVSKNLKQRWIAGSIIELDLKDGSYTYALVLKSPYVKFFNIIRQEDEDLPSFQKILNSEEIFQISVYGSAVRNEWLQLGKIKYDASIHPFPSTAFTQDSSTGEITIWIDKIGQIPGTLDDIKGMERLSVWEHGAVEQRLRDHFANRPCWWLQLDLPDTKRISAKEFYAQYGYDFHWLDDD